MNETAIILLSAVLIIACLCQWVAWRLKLPSILFLLLAGIIIGPIGHWFNPDQLLGKLLFPFISLSVSIILFEGSLSLKLDQIRGHGRIVFNLVTIGVLCTTILTCLFSHYLLSLPWSIAALFGSITAVSGPTVIVPMLRAIKPTRNIANILRWEGILIDPIGALVAILIFIGIISIHNNTVWTMVIWHFLLTLGLGVGIGVIASLILAYLIQQQWVPEYLHNLTTLSLVMLAFALSDHYAPGAGLFAVTTMGIMLANLPNVHIDEIVGFKESLSLILISTVFIILAARINFGHIAEVITGMTMMLLLIQFVIRPCTVFLSTLGSKRLKWQEKFLIAWIAPRGIIAASVAAIFSIQLTETHIASASEARLLILLTFIVIIGTVIFQSLTSRPMAKWLGVSEGEAKGMLIIGATPFSIALAKTLQQLQYHVILTTTNWHHTRLARMENIDCYYGNPVSEHADRHLDLVGIGALLAMSTKHDLNSLACIKYQREFGRHNVFILSPGQQSIKRNKFSHNNKNHLLFSTETNYQKLNELINQGWQIKTTQLTKNFDYHQYQHEHPNHIALLAIDARNKTWFFTHDRKIEPTAGWKIVSLMRP